MLEMHFVLNFITLRNHFLYLIFGLVNIYLTLTSLFQESDYFTPQGEFRVDSAGSQTLLNCLMYKLSYYRFGELQVSYCLDF